MVGWWTSNADERPRELQEIGISACMRTSVDVSLRYHRYAEDIDRAVEHAKCVRMSTKVMDGFVFA